MHPPAFVEDATIRNHEYKIRFFALRFVKYGVPLDELIQEGRVALLTAMRRWRPNHGASLWSYGRRYVHGAMFLAVGNHMKSPRGFDDDEAEAFPCTCQPVDEQIALFEMLDLLSPVERNVALKYLCEGKTLQEISSELRMPLTSTWEVCKRAVSEMCAEYAREV